MASKKSSKKSSTISTAKKATSKSKYETIEMYAKRIDVPYSVAKFCRRRGVDPYKTWSIFSNGRWLDHSPLFETKKEAEEYIDAHGAKYPNTNFKSIWSIKRLSEAKELSEPRAPDMEGNRRVKGVYH